METTACEDDFRVQRRLHILPPDSILHKQHFSPNTEEKMAAEIKGIYAGLVMVEAKFIETDAARTSSPDPVKKMDAGQWQALIALRRTLLCDHHDFLMATQHPSATPSLSHITMKFSMPARMWKHGIHAFLEVLRHQRPASQEYMLAFIYLAYQMSSLLYDVAPLFTNTWTEYLGGLARYRMAIEEVEESPRQWSGAADSWYLNTSERHPETGRLYHHLAILERPSRAEGPPSLRDYQNHLGRHRLPKHWKSGRIANGRLQRLLWREEVDNILESTSQIWEDADAFHVTSGPVEPSRGSKTSSKQNSQPVCCRGIPYPVSGQSHVPKCDRSSLAVLGVKHESSLKDKQAISSVSQDESAVDSIWSCAKIHWQCFGVSAAKLVIGTPSPTPLGEVTFQPPTCDNSSLASRNDWFASFASYVLAILRIKTCRKYDKAARIIAAAALLLPMVSGLEDSPEREKASYLARHGHPSTVSSGLGSSLLYLLGVIGAVMLDTLIAETYLDERYIVFMLLDAVCAIVWAALQRSGDDPQATQVCGIAFAALYVLMAAASARCLAIHVRKLFCILVIMLGGAMPLFVLILLSSLRVDREGSAGALISSDVTLAGPIVAWGIALLIFKCFDWCGCREKSIVGGPRVSSGDTAPRLD
ncbi:hypothetical protein LTR62_008687 [Meristemomyces frigidus]|uniref:Uncharacterized protein n=1 Tax=Meristemomyces frigidus TaxID=1508187 RepID=A0AAN7T9S3_9PEZI|nr:hypothetical protein LTR62_008687 [Meristemomyces frigidus]